MTLQTINGEQIWLPAGAVMGAEMIDPQQRNRADSITFIAYGTPAPQGSMKAFVIAGRARVTSDNSKLRPYRHTLTQVAALTMQEQGHSAPLCARPCAVEVTVIWTLAKPKSAPKRVIHPTKKPDTDKLLRAVLDSLTGVAYEDDSQVVRVTAEKQSGEPERTEITVRRVQEGACK